MNTNFEYESLSKTRNPAETWNERLGTLIRENFGTQKEFAQKFKEVYGVGNQADVSRWINVGSLSAKGKTIGFPEYSTMQKIAAFFHVTVGYLIGETDYETFEMEQACKYFGISEEAGKVLKKVTGSNHDCIEHGYQSDDYQRIISTFFTSGDFQEFIYDLRQLDEMYNYDNRVYKKLEIQYGKNALDEVNALQRNGIDYEHDPDAPHLTDRQVRIWCALDKANGNCYENSFSIKLMRYELHEAFERLIDSLYPR